MDTLIMAGQLILALSILVSLHEFGHYITAKWFKMRVDRFYLFFDFLFPLQNVWNFALFKKKIGDTEYGLGWFPLGGYVSIAGMIDETQDANSLAEVPEPWEFRAKPAWQRLIVMLGGIIVNVILGVVVFIGITKKNGENYLKMDSVNKRGIVALELGQYAGFKTGDKVLEINGKKVERFEDLRGQEIIYGNQTKVTVLRAGQKVTFSLPEGFLNKLTDKKAEFIDPMYHFKVGEVLPSLQEKKTGLVAWIKRTFMGENEPTNGEDAISPAQKAGLKADDKILAVNDQTTEYFHEFQAALAAQKNKDIRLTIQRNSKIDTLQMRVSSNGKIGIGAAITDTDLQPTHRDIAWAEALKVGTAKAFNVIDVSIKGFGKIFSGQVRPDKAISGPVAMAQLFGAVWDWDRFWNLVGLLSMSLAFMNLLPIPALDGGHAIFLIYEMILGRAPSVKFMERAQGVGTFILLGLMFFALGNDIFKIFR
jgi:regulator of sigma E protease